MNAQIVNNAIPVEHSVRPDVGREFLTIKCPNGWDDVQHLTKKVLLFNGHHFVFSGWNSDTNQCYFYRLLDNTPLTATVI